ncbi:MAG: phospholipase D-like domain-containing protein [archaeon]|jgi:phosphatidylserine/phosphatidylglycerophosphate/cardiolipin synthase-like enzyme
MNKRHFYIILFFIILLLSIFLFLIYLEVNDYQKSLEKKSTLNLGQTGETDSPQIYFCPEDNCQEVILSLIQDANKTIDCAVYDISSKEVSEVFINKKEQGLEIRIVTDKGRSQTKTTMVGNLKSAEINVLISPTIESYMHNKFCVFDGNKVLIGSTNFTSNSFSESYNNILVFENQRLAETLTKKIDSFYFGNFSKDSTVLGETISPTTEISFCPNSNCKQKVLDEISSAKETIECMQYSFTLDDIGDEMLNAKERGVDVKVIFETQQLSEYSEYEKLKQLGVSVVEDNDPYLMHNKYCVFDGGTIITGSMNYSANGTNNNDETLLVIKDENLSKQYKENFQKYWVMWNNQGN